VVILHKENLSEKKFNILVIGINYSPEPTGSAPYTAGLAEMLAGAGYRVEAFVGVPHYPWWSALPQDRFRLRRSELRNGVHVRHHRHFVPGKQTMFRRIAWELTFYCNVRVSKPKNQPDLVIASTPSLSGALLGVHFSKTFRVPLITVVQDVVGEAVTKSGLKVGDMVGKKVVNIEQAVFRKSSRVCIVSSNFRQYVIKSKLSTDHILDFPNWSHIPSPTKTRAEARSELGWSEEDFILLHTGNMGLKQDLGNLIQTAKLFENEPKFHIILCGDGNQKSKLEKLALGVLQIEFMDPVSDSEFPNLLTAADILIVNERDSVGNMSLPSKLTSYLVIGKPIIAAVNPIGACATELEKTHGAAIIVNAGEPTSLAAAIRSLAQNTEVMSRMSGLGRDYAELFLSSSSARVSITSLVSELIRSGVELN